MNKRLLEIDKCTSCCYKGVNLEDGVTKAVKWCLNADKKLGEYNDAIPGWCPLTIIPEIIKTQLNENDIIVIKYHVRLTEAQVNRIDEEVSKRLKEIGIDNEVLFLDKSVDLEIISKEEE